MATLRNEHTNQLEEHKALENRLKVQNDLLQKEVESSGVEISHLKSELDEAKTLTARTLRKTKEKGTQTQTETAVTQVRTTRNQFFDNHTKGQNSTVSCFTRFAAIC